MPPCNRYSVRHRWARIAGLAVAMLLVPATGVAETYPKQIERAVAAGLKVEKRFPAGSGLTGWVLSQEGRHTLVYTTQDGKTLLAGTLIGEDGRNLSSEHEEKHVPKPDLAGAFGELEKSAYVVEGPKRNPKNHIYVFVDANCPFCHSLWKALQPYESAGLQVRWVLVDTLGPTSMPKAIEVLAAPDTTKAFRTMEERFGQPWKGSDAASEARQPAVAAKIRSHTSLMQKLKLFGTPGIVWRDGSGRINTKAGMPRLAELPAITGLPEQKIDDPSLARFR